MNENIREILESNYYQLLKKLESKSPADFSTAVNEIDEEKSLFISFFEKDNSFSFIEKVLPLFEKYGYSLSQENKTTPKPKAYQSSGFFVHDEKEKMPDLLWALAKCNDGRTSDFLLKSVPVDYLKKLDNEGWELFKVMAKKQHVDAAKYLADSGIRVDFTRNNLDEVVNIADKNKSILEIYWNTVNKEKNGSQYMPSNEFDFFKKAIDAKSSRVYKKKSIEVEHIVKNIQEQKDRLSEDQKLDILTVCFNCMDNKLFKDTLKVFGYKIKEEKILNLILNKLTNSENMEYGYLFLDEKYFKQPTQFVEKFGVLMQRYGVHEINDLLSKLNVNVADRYTRDRNKEEKWAGAVFTRMSDSFGVKGYDFLFEKPDGSDKTMFEIIAAHRNGTTQLNSINFILNIGYEKKNILKFKTIKLDDVNLVKAGGRFTSEQHKELRKILENTWFKKDSNNKYFIENYSPWILSRKSFTVLNETILSNVLNKEEKFSFVRWGLNNISNINTTNPGTDDYISYSFKKFYEELKLDDNFDWRSINFDRDKFTKEAKDKEIYFEINALLMKSELGDKKNTDFIKRKNKI